MFVLFAAVFAADLAAGFAGAFAAVFAAVLVTGFAVALVAGLVAVLRADFDFFSGAMALVTACENCSCTVFHQAAGLANCAANAAGSGAMVSDSGSGDFTKGDSNGGGLS